MNTFKIILIVLAIICATFAYPLYGLGFFGAIAEVEVSYIEKTYIIKVYKFHNGNLTGSYYQHAYTKESADSFVKVGIKHLKETPDPEDRGYKKTIHL